jgi:hypothetical protein
MAIVPDLLDVPDSGTVDGWIQRKINSSNIIARGILGHVKPIFSLNGTIVSPER